MIALPTVTRTNQIVAMAIAYVTFSIAYLGASTLGLGATTTLAPNAVDDVVPFWPASIWLYFTQFLLLPLAIANARDDLDRSHTLYAMLMATFIAAVVFVLWPTQLERTIPAGGALTERAWQMLARIDPQGNCFPSLHVALASIAGRALWRRGWQLIAVVWPASIAVSTLTTRQHVAWDLVGGAVVAAVAVWLTPRMIRLERSKPVSHTAGA